MDGNTEQTCELVPQAVWTADGHTPSCCTETHLNLKAICSPACTQWPVTSTSARSAARLHLVCVTQRSPWIRGADAGQTETDPSDPSQTVWHKCYYQQIRISLWLTQMKPVVDANPSNRCVNTSNLSFNGCNLKMKTIQKPTLQRCHDNGREHSTNFSLKDSWCSARKGPKRADYWSRVGSQQDFASKNDRWEQKPSNCVGQHQRWGSFSRRETDRPGHPGFLLWE